MMLSSIRVASSLRRYLSSSLQVWQVQQREASSFFLQEMFSLEGRSAIVTGGGTGIGATLAEGLTRAGAKVTLTGRREGPLQETCEEIENTLKEKDQIQEIRAFHFASDVTDASQLDRLVSEAQIQTGIPPTIIIHCAGVNVRQKAHDLTIQHWQSSLDLMLTAPFMLTRAMSNNMKKEQYGRVVNIASLQSFRAFPDSIPYAAAKSGVLGLTRALSEAYSSPHGYENVTCNAVAPGYVKTELTKSVFADKARAQRLADATLLGRNSVPQDLVGATIFLCSPAASYVTGQTLPVDGGFTSLGLR